MKKLLSVILILLLISTSLCLVSTAKDLEPCNLCHTSGTFICNSCGNRVYNVCDNCGGKGSLECDGESGKGKCNNGYYTCTSCNGDGKNRSGDGQIIEGNCGNCNGKGKIECVVCHGLGRKTCNRCGGAGKQECQNENCIQARKIGFKCPKCMGTGYLLTNFWPGENDGKQNKPQNGDKIWVNGKSTTYGSGSTDNKTTESAQTTRAQSQNDNSNKNDVQTTSQGQNEVTSKVDVTGEGQTQNETNENHILPSDRKTDFEVFAKGDDDSSVDVEIRIELDKMTQEQRAYYNSLTDEQLAKILDNVAKIAATAQPGRMDEETENLLRKLAKANGFEDIKDAMIYPIYFEGHQDIGFPVKVRIKVEEGILNGGNPVYFYHLADNGDMKALGVGSEVGTYEDGSVEYISFYTDSFSSFFTSLAELNLDIDLNEPIPEKDATNAAVVLILTGLLVAVILITAGVVVIIKKKKNKTKQA